MKKYYFGLLAFAVVTVILAGVVGQAKAAGAPGPSLTASIFNSATPDSAKSGIISGYTKLEVKAVSDPYTPINMLRVYSVQKYILGTYYADSADVADGVWHPGFGTIGLNNGTNNTLMIDGFSCRGVGSYQYCVLVARTTLPVNVQNVKCFIYPWVKIIGQDDGMTVYNNGTVNNTIKVGAAIKNFDLRYPPNVTLRAVYHSDLGNDITLTSNLCTFNGIKVMTYSCSLNLPKNGMYTLYANTSPTAEYIKAIPLADKNTYASSGVNVALRPPATIATITSLGGMATLANRKVTAKATIKSSSDLAGKQFVLVFNKLDDDYGDMGPYSRVRQISYTYATSAYTVPANQVSKTTSGGITTYQAGLTYAFDSTVVPNGDYTLTINDANSSVQTFVAMNVTVANR